MREQRQQLPVTRSTDIIQYRGSEVYYLIVIVFVFTLVNVVFGTFIGAVVVSGVLYFLYSRFMNNRPPKFVQHLVLYFFTRKRYTHQYHAKEVALVPEVEN